MLNPDDGPGVDVVHLDSEIALALDADPENGLAPGGAQDPKLSDGRQVGRRWGDVADQRGLTQQGRETVTRAGLVSGELDQVVGVGLADLAGVAFLDAGQR